MERCACNHSTLKMDERNDRGTDQEQRGEFKVIRNYMLSLGYRDGSRLEEAR